MRVDKSIVVVDNCSTDGTRDLLLRKFGQSRRCDSAAPGRTVLREDELTIVLEPANFEKGTSIKTGLALADGEYVVCQDADLEYDPADILRLLEHAERTGARAVFGSRLLEYKARRLDSFQFGRVALSLLFRLLYGGSLTDVATCYKLLQSEVMRGLELRASGFDLDFEIPAKLRRQKHDIVEVPVSYTPRSHEQGKKLRWSDGVFAVWALAKCRVA